MAVPTSKPAVLPRELEPAEAELERAAVAGGPRGGHGEVAAVGERDLAGDRQAEAGAGSFAVRSASQPPNAR
jgi:hypothetical protein